MALNWIKCECGTRFNPELFHDCPECYEEEYDRYIETVFARQILEHRFRSVTPPPDRRRMSTGRHRSYENPLR